jgi:protein-disulfide isomerase
MKERRVKGILLRLSGSLVVVLGLWTVVWLPLVVGETSAAADEPLQHSLGDPNAPVTIIEYSSLTCPHCAQFHNEVLPELKERYIATGKVRLVYRDFPLDQRALEASVLAHCAGPDRYFGLLEVMFRTQPTWARAGDLSQLKGLGRLAGMSEAQMEACLADEELVDGILRTRLEGQEEYDLRSTPTFIIGGQSHAGTRSVEEFSALIEPLL